MLELKADFADDRACMLEPVLFFTDLDFYIIRTMG